MTASNSMTGASPTCISAWSQINWKQAEAHVHRLQMRIAKAVNRLCLMVPGQLMAFKRLEPCAGKPARTVLRRVVVGNGHCLSATTGLHYPLINF
jgi:hypothetical protein